MFGFAAIQAWAQAVETAGTTDFEPVIEALHAGTFNAVLGEFGFDGKGDVTAPGYLMYVWKNGEYDYY